MTHSPYPILIQLIVFQILVVKNMEVKENVFSVPTAEAVVVALNYEKDSSGYGSHISIMASFQRHYLLYL